MNRFKGLDLVSGVSEELWTEVCNIIQEAAKQKKIPKEKKCKKAKWLSEVASQLEEERSEMKSEGGRERYTQPNAEFQRIARRDKNAFFSEQCKQIEGNNRKGKTRDLFKNVRNIKVAFHPIKERNSEDLEEEEEEIRKRWKENTELYRKDLNDPDNHDGVASYSEPDILKCKGKWTLGNTVSIKLV